LKGAFWRLGFHHPIIPDRGQPGQEIPAPATFEKAEAAFAHAVEYDDRMKLRRFKFGIVIAGTLLGALAGVSLEELSLEGAVSAGPSYYPDFVRRVNFIKYVLAGAAIALVVDTIVNGLPTVKRYSLGQLMLAVAACAMACYVAGQIWEAFRPRRY
jgi:hypothetical protein